MQAGSDAALYSESERRLDAWLSLPDGDRAELLDSRIVYKTMPSIEHGDAILGIAGQLDPYRGPPSGSEGGWWLSQDVEMFLSGQGLRPDMVGWRVERHPDPPEKVNVAPRHRGVYTAAPDWVCEVLSASTRSQDLDEGVKWRASHSAGVGHYWLVDLVRRQITVYVRRATTFEPVDVAGVEAEKPLAPFVARPFMTRRVFLMRQR
jgi:Uma2 family endonuclease